MRISVLAAAVLCLAPTAPAAGPMTDRDIEAWLPRLLESGQRYLNIEPVEGAYLRSLVVKVNAKRALELGTSTGYSGIWIAMGLRQTGGSLTTIEIDRGRHDRAVENFRTVGLAGLIDARLADALRETAKVEGPLDFVFIDANKPDYLAYYEMVLPKMRRGGVITAHNVVSNARAMADFLERIQTDPKVRSEIVTPGWQGISVSFVK